MRKLRHKNIKYLKLAYGYFLLLYLSPFRIYLPSTMRYLTPTVSRPLMSYWWFVSLHWAHEKGKMASPLSIRALRFESWSGGLFSPHLNDAKLP